MNNMELRIQDGSMQVKENGELIVQGYVNETNQFSKIIGIDKKFREKISKGAFSRALSINDDIDFLAEHDNKKILSSTRNGSLILNEDNHGLLMEATITPTSYGKDYFELIKSGILRNMSFGFKVIKESWSKAADGIFERTIDELELLEVSVVKNPAYAQSTISARGIDLVQDSVPLEISEYSDMNDFEKRFYKNNIIVQIEKLNDDISLFGADLKGIEEIERLKNKLKQIT